MKKINNQEIIKKVESIYLKKNNIVAQVGDIIKLKTTIQEGEKSRLQSYEGIVIAKKNVVLNKAVIVRSIMQGIGIERNFILNSPKIESIEIKRSSKVRRSKLYYLRKLSGKATRLKQIF